MRTSMIGNSGQERTPHSIAHILVEVREFWQQFFARAFDPYRPERHYMRGPGPAYKAKHRRAR